VACPVGCGENVYDNRARNNIEIMEAAAGEPIQATAARHIMSDQRHLFVTRWPLLRPITLARGPCRVGAVGWALW
jgi:hypothetical protein